MLVKMICPQCGASLDMDDSREFMFCSFCGTKIANLSEKVHVTHSGTVTIDESGKIGNFWFMVVNALNSRNFIEAYTYCMRIMEIDPTHLCANLYKGLTAVMQSTPTVNRIAEGKNAMKLLDFIKEISAEEAEELRSFVDYTNSVIPILYETQCVVQPSQSLSLQEANNLSRLSYDIVSYLTVVASSLNDNLLRSAPSLEESKLAISFTGIKLAELSKKPVPYVSGNITKTDRKGRAVTVPKIVSAPCKHAKELQNCIITLKHCIADIPSRMDEIARLENEIIQRKQVVNQYEIALNAFFADRPYQKKAYMHPGLIGRDKKLAVIEKTFPQELIDFKALSNQAEAEIAQMTEEKNRLLRQRIIK